MKVIVDRSRPPVRVGLPRMHKEAGERRDFLPRLVAFLDHLGASEIVLEEGYGTGMDVLPSDYLAASRRARFATYEECLDQDMVLVVRCPDADALARLRPGAMLLSMLHFPTRPTRVALLSDLGVTALSLDSIADDAGHRLVENLEAVAWNGVRAAFRALAETLPRFMHPGRHPIRVTCMGSGAVGGHAGYAATRYGDRELRGRMVSRRIPGVEVTVIDYDLTDSERYMRHRLAETDLLIDATQRGDPSQFVVPNAWVGLLTEHAVMLDLSVDPYDFEADPPEVKGIEGMPEGDLDQYLFFPDDPVYERLDPRIDARNRRVALSCYSWPGVQPRSCMEMYGAQLEPVLRLVAEKPASEWRVEGGAQIERAVARAELSRWMSARAA